MVLSVAASKARIRYPHIVAYGHFMGLAPDEITADCCDADDEGAPADVYRRGADGVWESVGTITDREIRQVMELPPLSASRPEAEVIRPYRLVRVGSRGCPEGAGVLVHADGCQDLGWGALPGEPVRNWYRPLLDLHGAVLPGLGERGEAEASLWVHGCAWKADASGSLRHENHEPPSQ